MQNEMETKALEMLRTLYKMGVTLNGCGCCGSPTIEIEGVKLEVEGGIELTGRYNYVFSYPGGSSVFTLAGESLV